MVLIFKLVLALIMYLVSGKAIATTLNDINITNSFNQSTIILGFNEKPVFTFFPLHNPERVVVDIYHSSAVRGLPFNFSGENIIKSVRTSNPINRQNLRLVFELTNKSYIRAITRRINGHYNVILTVISQYSSVIKSQVITSTEKISNNKIIITKKSARIPISMLHNNLTIAVKPIVVAIDAGHGGQDPGATGPNGLHEKNVTIAIARKLKNLLDNDPMFKSVLTRDKDHFISVMGRSDVARRKGASVLVSIHTDAALNRNTSGASVWVLSNRRANSEMANWLEQHEKQYELLGGAGDLLSNNQHDPYFSKTVLDLQFGHSQRVGYDIAVKVLDQLQHVSTLHKFQPEYANFGVLRSPDIPSLLVESGFITSIKEERLLGNSAYQNKIANALHLGLRSYFLTHPS